MKTIALPSGWKPFMALAARLLAMTALTLAAIDSKLTTLLAQRTHCARALSC